MPLVNLGLVQPEVVIDISRADGPRDVSVADGFVTVGALITHARLALDPVAARWQPLLGAAARRIGNGRVRSRGTLGGSLAHSDPAAELPLVMVALGGVYSVTDGLRSREVKAEEFHLGFLTTQLAEDELVVSARVPALGPGWGWSFREVSRRHGDFALAAAAALVRMAGGVIVESRVAVGGVADRPVRLADGSVKRMQEILVQRVEIGSLTIRNVEASIVPDNTDMLLGMSVLAIGRFTIDRDANRLVFD